MLLTVRARVASAVPAMVHLLVCITPPPWSRPWLGRRRCLDGPDASAPAVTIRPSAALLPAPSSQGRRDGPRCWMMVMRAERQAQLGGHEHGRCTELDDVRAGRAEVDARLRPRAGPAPSAVSRPGPRPARAGRRPSWAPRARPRAHRASRSWPPGRDPAAGPTPARPGGPACPRRGRRPAASSRVTGPWASCDPGLIGHEGLGSLEDGAQAGHGLQAARARRSGRAPRPRPPACVRSHRRRRRHPGTAGRR